MDVGVDRGRDESGRADTEGTRGAEVARDGGGVGGEKKEFDFLFPGCLLLAVLLSVALVGLVGAVR